MSTIAGCVVVLLAAGCGRVGFEQAQIGGDGTSDGLGIGGANVAFVSSFFIIPGNLGGLAGADERCTVGANAAGLEGDFVAFLSTKTSTAADRLAGRRGWKRPDGLLIADSIADLSSGIVHLLNVDELGNHIGFATVATATDADGTLAINEVTCGDWTIASSEVAAGGRTDVTSTDFASRGISPRCNGSARLFCFGARSSMPLEAVRNEGRLAFVSTGAWTPGGGLADADLLCSTEASAAGFLGTFRALLPTSADSAASRFDLTGLPWVRVDGARVAATPDALMASLLDTTLNRTANGLVYDGFVWSGYTLGVQENAFVPGNNTCQDWSSSAANTFGGLGDTRYATFIIDPEGSGAQCNFAFPIYCLET